MINNIKEIETRLSNIENLLINQKEVLTFTEFCQYCGISKSYGYKLTSSGKVPHYKNGKMVYFNRLEVEAWLQRTPVKTPDQFINAINNKGGAVC